MKTRLGELELTVMDFIWRRDGVVTVPDVQAHLLKKRKLAYTSTMTVMHRLWKKGLLNRSDEQRPHTYWPAVSREDYSADLMVGVLREFGDERAVLTRFVERVGPKEAEMLRKLTNRGKSR